MRIEFADLGDWGDCELRSEYDPREGAIRINTRVVEALPEEERAAFVSQAIAHEMYHHLEHCGVIPVIANRSDREAAANCHREVSNDRERARDSALSSGPERSRRVS